MTWASRLLSHRTARTSALASAKSAATTSTVTPTSGNSKAFVAAASELAQSLDFLLDNVNYEDEPGDLLQLHLERLSDEAAKYTNSRLPLGQGREWTCSPDMAKLFYIACQCSCLVYKPLPESDLDLIPVSSRASSATGTTKALSMWTLYPQKALIVSIRGTACVMDHMVNVNADAEDAKAALSLPMEVTAHKGFLTCARALLPYLTKQIAWQLELNPELEHVIFTGHSAGGSVASLVFLHFAYKSQSKLSLRKVSLATFGAAPVVAGSVADLAALNPNVGWALAFVNEFDLVARIDRPYIKSVIDLYRTRYDQSCPATGHPTFPPLTVGSLPPDKQPATAWPLPKPSYRLVGDIILSTKSLRSSISHDAASDSILLATVPLHFIKIPPDNFENLVFCEVGVHKKRVYLERMKYLSTAHATDVNSLYHADTLYSMGSRTTTTETVVGEE